MFELLHDFYENNVLITSFVFYSLLLFTLAIVINLFDRAKGIILMNEEDSFVLTNNQKKWLLTNLKHKQISFIATALMVLLVVVSFILGYPHLIAGTVVILMWKIISFISPTKIVFSPKGIYVVDLLVVGDRRHYFDRVEWSEVESVSIKNELNELVIISKEKVTYLPISDENIVLLTKWIDIHINVNSEEKESNV